MKKIFTATIAALAVLSCDYVRIPVPQLEELGVYTNDYEVDESSGILDIDIISSGPSTVSILDDITWIDLSAKKISGDCTLKLAYEENDGFPRKARLLVSLDANPEYSRDTITIRQRGYYEPYLSLPHSGLTLYNEGEDFFDVEVLTNIPEESVTIQKRILDGTDDWLSGIEWTEEGKIRITTTDNTGDTKRTAVVSFVYDNGWGEQQMVNLRLTQLNADDELGRLLSFEDIRGMAGQTLSDDLYFEAYVVSDVNSGNVNENPMLSSSSIDYDVCRRSIYLQDKNGSYGFLALTATDADNVFKMDTKVNISLGGVTVRKYDAPERYVLDGLKATSLLSAENVEIPVKERTIGQLTDNDIYTRVLLKDVEWPVRKGSLSPCFERMTNAADVDAATKFATLLRDKDGNSMYIYTNTTCPYRRNGSRMPYGSGDMSGVIVHEKHIPFVDEDAELDENCGNIGNYQIRHMSRSDFRMAEDFSDSFSEMICEFRYIDGYENGKMQATYGTGTLTHTYNSGNSIIPYYDFSYLGPIGTEDGYFFGKNFGNINGFGIITEEGLDYGLDFAANADMYSAGRTGRSDGETLSWAVSYWWNSTSDTPYYWVVDFSTAGISSDVLSLQLSMLNQCQVAGKNTPRNWKIEWGVSDDDEEVGDWKHLADFVLPDITPTSAPLILSMSCAFKPMDFKLPAEMLGHENVSLRIGPSRNNAGQALGTPVYQGLTISSNAIGAGSMTYLAIRYNK